MAKRFLCGLVLGMAAIAPGVSAGVMMVAFDLYREILQALGELMRFRRIRQNLVFLLPLGLGALVSLPLLGLGLECGSPPAYQSPAPHPPASRPGPALSGRAPRRHR